MCALVADVHVVACFLTCCSLWRRGRSLSLPTKVLVLCTLMKRWKAHRLVLHSVLRLHHSTACVDVCCNSSRAALTPLLLGQRCEPRAHVQDAVKEALAAFDDLLSSVDDETRASLQRSMGMKMEQLKAELDMLVQASLE